MTNEDKYLKDGVSVEELANEIARIDQMNLGGSTYNAVKRFFNLPAITLTEDERVILRNIDTDYYTTIKKMGETLYIVNKEDEHKEIEYMFKDHLFQFIKERRRIQHTRIIRRWEVMEILIGAIITILAVVIVLEAIDISYYMNFIRPALKKARTEKNIV